MAEVSGGTETWELLAHYAFEDSAQEVYQVIVDFDAGKYDKFYIYGDFVLTQSNNPALYVNDIVWSIIKIFTTSTQSATKHIIVSKDHAGIVAEVFGRNAVNTYPIHDSEDRTLTTKPMDTVSQIKIHSGHMLTYFADGTDFYIYGRLAT